MEIDDWEILVGKVVKDYKLEKVLKEGSYGVTFKATDLTTRRKVAFKLLKIVPSDGSWIEEAWKAGQVENCDLVVKPVGIIKNFELKLDDNNIYIVNGIGWDYINDNAKTLNEFLYENSNITVDMILEILEQLCISIKAMHDCGIEHGDLHEGNIMIIPPPYYLKSGRNTLKVIDFGLASDVKGKYNSDILSLKKIIQRLWKLSMNYEGEYIMGDKKFINTLPQLIARINDSHPERGLHDPVQILHKIYELKNRSLIDFSKREIKLDDPFEYTSVEEIPEDSDLLSYLFTENLPWFDEIKTFGNYIISGIRGCGKSMILKNMRLKTKLMSEIERQKIDNYDYIGFYIHSIHDLNIPFEGLVIDDSIINMDMMLHYFNLLYTLEIIDSLILYVKVMNKKFLDKSKRCIYDFINEFFEEKGVLFGNVDIFVNLKTLLERETKLIIEYIKNNRLSKNLTGVSYLLKFCDILIRNIPLFTNKKIYFLLDDFSDARGIRIEIQKSFNRVIGIRNNKYCFKISTERFAYTLQDSQNNLFQQDREFKYYDLSREYVKHKKLSDELKFVKTIINKRFKASGLNYDIEKLLGNYKFPDGNIGRSLGNPDTNKKTLYAGFKTICQLCSGDISTLLELIRAIFIEAKNKKTLNVDKNIPFKLQNDVIIEFSRNRLSYIKEESKYGYQLYNIATTFGMISKLYLDTVPPKKDKNKKLRYDERIRIYVKGTKTIKEEIIPIYKNLLKYGIFTEEGKKYLWEDKFHDLNLVYRRIYTPAFKISYRSKQSLILSPEQFEELLQYPQTFLKNGTKLLRSVMHGKTLDYYYKNLKEEL